MKKQTKKEIKVNIINKNILYSEKFNKYLLNNKPLILEVLTANMSKASKLTKNLENKNSNERTNIIYNLLLKILKECEIYENESSNQILKNKKNYILKLSKSI